METLNYSPKEFYETIQQVLRIKHFLYERTRRPAPIGGYGFMEIERIRAEMGHPQRGRDPEYGEFSDHFPGQNYGSFMRDVQQTWTTPRELFIQTSFLSNEYVVSFCIKARDGKEIILQTIKMKEGEFYQPVFCQVAPYVDPLFARLRQKTERVSILMDLDDERRKEKFIQTLLRG